MEHETSLRLMGISPNRTDRGFLSKIFNINKLSVLQQQLYRRKMSQDQKTHYDEITILILHEMMAVGNPRKIYLKIFGCILLYISTVLIISFGTFLFTDSGIRLIYKFLIWIGLVKIDKNPTRQTSSMFNTEKQPTTIYDAILDGKFSEFAEELLTSMSKIFIIKEASEGIQLIVQTAGIFAGINILNEFTGSVLGFILQRIMNFVLNPIRLNFFKMIITTLISVFLVFLFYMMLKADIMNKSKLIYFFLALSFIFLSNWGIRRFTQFLVDQIVNDDSSRFSKLILVNYATNNAARTEFLNNIRQAGIPVRSHHTQSGIPVDTFHVRSSRTTENDDLQGVVHDPREHILSRWTGEMLLFIMKIISKLSPSVSTIINDNRDAAADRFVNMDQGNVAYTDLMNTAYRKEHVVETSPIPRHRSATNVHIHNLVPANHYNRY
jgi:hypothetical protein